MKTFLEMIRTDNFLVLDTETTGLGNDAEICQIAVVSAAGTVLLDTLVKPTKLISAGAAAIHGITDAMVENSPVWGEVSAWLREILSGRDVVIYNAVFDRKLMHQSAEQCGMPKIGWKQIATFHCAMLAFAEIYGDWNDYYKSYRWKTLATAAAYYKLPIIDAHHALGDCLTTLAVCKAMAQLPIAE
jgi:DNA polymerase III subunit epsilon